MKFVSLLKNPQFLATSLSISLLLLLVLVLWLLGLPPLQIFIVLVTIAIIWNVYFLLKQKQDAKKSKKFEAELTQQADDQVYSTRPDKRPEILDLKEKLDKAIAALKDSKLGRGQSGKAALYTLPWYMIIGPPGSGKSTALRFSELEFPYVDPESKDPKVKGLGGTQNCDFWFTTDGVLLDTAGRYVTPMAQAEDRREWQTFLNYLKKHRRRMPINGVIVAVSIAEDKEKFFGVLTSDAATIERHARNIRNRIDELIKTLEIEFPIYLVFTKCDRLNGFVEFFDDMDKSSRNQVWGYTFPKAQWGSKRLPNIFKQEFKHLFKYLTNRRVFKLGMERTRERKRNVFLFPLEFYSARKKLCLFLDKLLEYNRYMENPILRGFYFTSGTQVGNPIDRVVSKMAKEFGIKTRSLHQPPTETRSYFIKDLMSKIIFPDRDLVAPANRGVQRKMWLRLAAAAGMVAAFGLLWFGMGTTFKQNRTFLKRHIAHMAQLRKVNRSAAAPLLTSRFESVRTDIVRLRQASFRRKSLGLDVAALTPVAEQVYFQRWRDLTLKPLKSILERKLAQTPQGPHRSDYRATLKSYLYLTGQCKPDSNIITLDLANLWLDSRQHAAAAAENVRAQFRAYARELVAASNGAGKNGRTPAHWRELTIPPIEKIIKQSRDFLLQAPATLTILDGWRDRASRQLSYQPLPADQNVLQSTSPVNGLFTRSGWRTIVSPELQRLGAAGGPTTDCVLGDRTAPLNSASPDRIQAELRRLYREQYADGWQRFIAGLQIRQSASLSDAAQILRTLAGKNSPFLHLLREIETSASPPGQVSNGGTVSYERLSSLVSVPDSAEGPPPLQAYLEALAALQGRIQALANSDNSGADAVQLLTEVVSEQAEINSAWLAARAPLPQPLTATERQIAGLLKQPITDTWNVVRKQATEHLNTLWRRQVFAFYDGKIGGRYPFTNSPTEAFLPDVVEFFKPGGVLWGFFDQHLAAIVERGNWRAKTWQGRGVAVPLATLKKAEKITRALFPDGAAEPLVRFELEPRLPGTTRRFCLGVSHYGATLEACTGQRRQWPLQWPNPGAAQSIVIRVASQETGAATQSLQFNGSWALFRLLDNASISERTHNKIRITWQLSHRLGNQRGSEVNDIGLSIRPSSSREVFQQNFFTTFVCKPSLSARPLTRL